MDVDTLEQQQQQHPQDASSATDTGASSPEIQVQLSPDDPFDLEAYIAPYTGELHLTDDTLMQVGNTIESTQAMYIRYIV